VRDVRPLAQQWAGICACATPDTLGEKAKLLFATIVNPDVCLALWRDCAQVLAHVPPEAQVEFVDRGAGFACLKPDLAPLVVEAWCAVWAVADGDKVLVEALGQLITLSARTSAVAAPAVERLARSLEHAHAWAPQVVDAALGVIEASVASAGSSWPLTRALLPIYSFVLAQAAALAARQPVDVVSLLGALVSWKGYADEVGQGLLSSVTSQPEAVQILLSKSSDQKLARRIAGHIGVSYVLTEAQCSP